MHVAKLAFRIITYYYIIHNIKQRYIICLWQMISLRRFHVMNKCSSFVNLTMENSWCPVKGHTQFIFHKVIHEVINPLNLNTITYKSNFTSVMCKHVIIQHEIQNSNNFQMVYLNYKTKSTINRVHDKEQVTRTVQCL